MRDHGVHHLGSDDGPAGFVVEVLQQGPGLGVGENQAVLFMTVAMHGNTGIMKAGGQHHDHLGVLHGQTVVPDHAGLDAPFDQQAQDPQGGIGHDADMHLAMIADRGAVDGVHVGAAPQLVQFGVGIDAAEQPLQHGIVLGRDPEIHMCPVQSLIAHDLITESVSCKRHVCGDRLCTPSSRCGIMDRPRRALSCPICA